MVDMVAAGRAYEANASALKTGRDIAKRTLDILR
jgi:flagellar basal body rod protein FlgC